MFSCLHREIFDQSCAPVQYLLGKQQDCYFDWKAESGAFEFKSRSRQNLLLSQQKLTKTPENREPYWSLGSFLETVEQIKNGTLKHKNGFKTKKLAIFLL
jgi:hypothetical protein